MIYDKITISGKICTGKTTLLKNLENKLHWPVFMTGKLFREYVTKNKFDLDEVDEQNENLTKKIDYQVRDMINLPGNLIIDGWMSGIMAHGQPNILKVLLICRDEIRYQRFAEREKIGVIEAKKRVEERQSNWLDKLEKIYNRNDFMDPKNYDLIIDTSDISSEVVLKKVLSHVIIHTH
ncbi:MAG: cytidylate kinase family protein [Candidatus Roizmanbacteria bacterium]|nr:cytidylate kinase family protein [Candidatus Roizmanbacteria bacterium]